MHKRSVTYAQEDFQEDVPTSPVHQRTTSDFGLYEMKDSPKITSPKTVLEGLPNNEIDRMIEIFETNEPRNWNEKEVCFYLELIGLSNLIPKLLFLNGSLLVVAKEKDLIDLKIKDKDQRKSLLLGIEFLKDNKFKYDKTNVKTWNLRQCMNWFRNCGIYGKEEEEILKKLAVHGGVLAQLTSKEIIERFKLKSSIDIVKAKAVEQLLKNDPICFENGGYMSYDAKKISRWLEAIGFHKDICTKFVELKITGGIIASINLKDLGLSKPLTKSLNYAISGLIHGKTMFMNVQQVVEFYKDLNLDHEGIQSIQDNCIHGLFLSHMDEKEIRTFFPFKDSNLKVKKLKDEIEKMQINPYGSLKKLMSERAILIEKHEKISIDNLCVLCTRKCVSIKFESCSHGVCEHCILAVETLECRECKK